MNFTIDLPTKVALAGEWVCIDEIEDKYKNLRYNMKFYFDSVQNNLTFRYIQYQNELYYSLPNLM